MPTPATYPEALRTRAHQLYYVQKHRMKRVVQILQQEFPEFGTRLTVDRLHSVARQYRMKLKLPAKHPHMSKRSKVRKGAPTLRKASPIIKLKDKETVLSAAKRLRDAGFKFQAITEKLTVQFPNEIIPEPHHLALLMKTHAKKVGTILAVPGFMLSIQNPDGKTITKPIPEDKLSDAMLYLLNL